MNFPIAEVKFDEDGLLPAVVQHAVTRELLTLAYVNQESLERTLATGETWFWSRSRSCLWHKGETSGNTQEVTALTLDCDLDALRIMVLPKGPACHTGAQSCFHNQLQGAPEPPAVQSDLGATLAELYELVQTRKRERPAGSYTTYLFAAGLDKILKKVGEESAETIIAAKNDMPLELTKEVSDLIYHLIVLLVERGVSLDEIQNELAARRK